MLLIFYMSNGNNEKLPHNFLVSFLEKNIQIYSIYFLSWQKKKKKKMEEKKLLYLFLLLNWGSFYFETYFHR